MNRVPPQATEIEEAIIGSALMDAECLDVCMEIINEPDLYSPANRKVYNAILKVHKSGNPVDMITVEAEIKDEGINIVDYTRSAATPQTCRHYCHIVKEKSMLRSVIRTCQNITEQAYEPDADVFEISESLHGEISKHVDIGQGSLHDIVSTMQAVTSEIEMINSSGKPMGIPSGLDIDDILHGFQRGKLCIIGARPSMGKTALVMTIMRNIARSDMSAGIISLETSHINLGVRIASQVSGIPAEHLMSGQMTGEEIDRYNTAVQEIIKYGIYIDDSSGVTIQQLHSKASIMARKGINILFIDFLTLIKSSGRSRHEEVGDVSKMCKNIAKELNIPVVLLSQLSRKVEERNNKRPMMSDLRESGSIEEDADVIIFLYRPEYYGVTVDEMGNSTENIAEVIIAKNKDGKTGVKRQLFEKETMTFKNVVHPSRSTSPF